MALHPPSPQKASWHLSSFQISDCVVAAHHEISCCALSSKGDRLLIGSQCGTFLESTGMWPTMANQSMHSLIVLSGGYFVFGLDTGHNSARMRFSRLDAHDAAITAVCWSPSDSRMGSVSEDFSFCVWNSTGL
jgi:WD40 repeat protein